MKEVVDMPDGDSTDSFANYSPRDHFQSLPPT